MVEDTILEVLVVAIDRLADEVICRLPRASPLDSAYVETHDRRSVDDRRKTEAICIARRKGGSLNIDEISRLSLFK